MSDEFENIELRDLKELKARLTSTPLEGSEDRIQDKIEKRTPEFADGASDSVDVVEVPPIQKLENLDSIEVRDFSFYFEIFFVVVVVVVVVVLLTDKPKEEKYSKGIRNVLEEVRKGGGSSLPIEGAFDELDSPPKKSNILDETKRLLEAEPGARSLSNGLEK